MLYGAGPAIRLALVHAKPWQRYLIGVAMIEAGVARVSSGLHRRCRSCGCLG